MHLKTLTLRGFKSFASATTLRFEPGVTCVVGPNGSGKSNVVDALAWVMGEQGAKSLRGGKMEDVIFAGTAGRPPLGRAEVALTIDNTDGALPIDYTEVTISRTMFRNGGSEYAINGSSCRLLDIQELLSDTGMGREMHVIVGQGQLDTVLRATPEDRRGFIEEAAGVLKHRKRKEKAIRKLDAMQANLTRLTDLTAEIRRQLGPLGRQAEVARKAAIIRIDVRDARSRLLADELAQLTATVNQEKADETALLARRKEVETELETARQELTSLEQQAAAAAPALARAHEAWFSLSSLRERIRAVESLATERMRLLGAEEPAERGQDPDELQGQADRAAQAEADLTAEAVQKSAELADIVARREAAEAAASQAERKLADLARSAADRREGIARLAGQVGAKRSAIEAAEAEITRLREAHHGAVTRAEAARVEFVHLETQVLGDEEGEEGLDAAHEEAVAALDAVEARLAELKQQQESARRDLASWTAKRDTLELSLMRKDGAGHLLAEPIAGLSGTVAANITIEPGFEVAVAAVLGAMADGVVVDSVDHAVDAIRQLQLDDAGRAELLIVGSANATSNGSLPAEAGADARWLSDVVSASNASRSAISAFLHGVVVVDDLAQARAVIRANPELSAVTLGGDLLSAHRAIGGSADGPTTLELQAAFDEAQTGAMRAQQEIERATFDVEAATAAHAQAQERYDITLERLNDSDAKLTAIAEQLGHLGQSARAADDEAGRLAERISALEATLTQAQQELESLGDRLANAQRDPVEDEGVHEELQAERDERAAAAVQARAAETEARLGLRTVEERARALASRAQSLAQAAEAERHARAEAQRRHEERMLQAERASTVAAAAAQTLVKIDASLARAHDERIQSEALRDKIQGELATGRNVLESLTGTLRELTDHAHRDELARAQHQLRIEQLRERIVEELSVDPDVLMDEYGPHQLIPVLDETGQQLTEDGEPLAKAYVREEQEKRLAKAERALKTLGNINPLALEEFAALEERHTFLGEQLADLKKSRTDLLQIVEEIDEKVEAVFTAAYHDTAREFADIFPRLFPGGEGALVLTDPENMLSTGIDVEARPAGKKVKRLSLLSGGERSLVAVALLVAIFKARPSPFYVMDEVEAALDDANLGRLLEIFTELRDNSQLIVVTHQKRTMEIADALYGVTMRGDGVTTVISQRLESQD